MNAPEAAASAASATGPTPQARESLAHLADVVAPPPVPWVPQTIGWAVLAALMAIGLVWGTWRAIVRWRRNRYRREALRELQALSERVAEATARDDALRAVPPLLKRCALAAWPREHTAALSGAAWTTFLAAHARGGLDPALQRLLDDAEYHPRGSLQSVDAAKARAIVAAASTWVRHHHVVREDRRVPA